MTQSWAISLSDRRFNSIRSCLNPTRCLCIGLTWTLSCRPAAMIRNSRSIPERISFRSIPIGREPFSLFLGSKVVTSWRLHYLWNDVNDKPNLTLYPPGTREVQAGRAVHVNFATAYDLYDHRFYAGLNGYYFKQITETRINGRSVPGLEEQVLGIGPGAFFRFNNNASFFLNLYFETATENRPSGTRLNALFAFHF
jgi:hypothetical protein